MKKSKNTPNSLTREWMQQALLRLLRTKELSEISVTELTRTAGVARVTFYRNYNDMADVLFDYLENPKHGLPVPGAADFYLPQFIRDYFQFFHDNRALVFCIQKNNLLPRLMVTMEKNIGAQSYYLIAAYGFENPYEVSGLVGIFYKILLDWIRNGMKESIEEMSMVVYGIITKFNCVTLQ